MKSFRTYDMMFSLDAERTIFADKDKLAFRENWTFGSFARHGVKKVLTLTEIDRTLHGAL